MKEVNFKQSASEIMKLIGGKENVSVASHCITRLRFTLKDLTIAENNKEAIKKIPGVLQVIEAGGQFQVVIGTTVEKMYSEVAALLETGEGEIPEVNETKQQKKTTDTIMKLVSGIMMPVMPALIGCSMITCLLTILLATGLVDMESGTFTLFYGIGQTILYFFPVIIGGSAAKFFGISPYLGNAIGACMIYPSFVANAGEGLSTTIFGFIPLTYKDYSSTVFPAIAAVWFASIIFKFLKKHIPDILSFVVIPFLTILISVPVSILVIGPVVNGLSALISQGSLVIYNFSPMLCSIILGATWLLFIVPLGLHWGFIAIFLNNLTTLGYEPIMGLMAAILSLSGTLTAIGIRSKNKETKSLAFSCAITNMLGVSEPGLYGIVLQHKETILTTMIGGAITGIIPALFHCTIYTYGMSGIFAMPCYISPDGDISGMIGAIIANIVGFVLCFALTMFWKFDPDKTHK